MKTHSLNIPKLHFLSDSCVQEIQHLANLITGKRILVLGSGPSAQFLSDIPEDVLVFSCNMGPLMLLERKLRPRVDLYLVNKAAFKNYAGHIETMLQKLAIGTLLSRDTEHVRNLKNTISYDYLFEDRTTRSSFYLEELIKPHVTNEVLEGNGTLFTSTGVGLLQYALYFNAKEIFLSGIDLDIDRSGHVLVQTTAPRYHYHKKPDQNFLRWVTTHRSNVFSLSPFSPIAQSVPVKTWD